MADTIVELLTDVADAIREKKGSNEPINAQSFADEIRSIEGGEQPSVERKDVNFYDYEGTLLFSYTLTEAQALTKLPTPKGHEGLVFQGWNWDYEDVIALDYPMDIGALYTTDNGKTRLKVAIDREDFLDFHLYCLGASEIDWGDGVIESVRGGNIYHTYSQMGRYVIQIDGTNLSNIGATDLSQYTVTEINLGDTATTSNRMIGSIVFVQKLSFPKLGAINGYFLLAGSRKLKCAVLPQGLTNTQYFLRYSYGCERVCLPKITEISVDFSSSVGTMLDFPYTILLDVIPNSAFYYMENVLEFKFSEALISIGAMAFYGCRNARKYDFSRCTQVPTLANANAFTDTYANKKIVVPDALYDEWISATNWSTYANSIIKASEYGN